MNSGNTDEQLNLIKMVHNSNLLELTKKCESLEKSEAYWFLKKEEIDKKIKIYEDMIEKQKCLVNNLLILNSEANIRNNMLTKTIQGFETKLKDTNNIEKSCLNFNNTCANLKMEYLDETLQPQITELNEEHELLCFESEAPKQQIQDLQLKIAKLEMEIEKKSELVDVVQTVQNQLKSKAELEKKLNYYKRKMLFPN